MDKINIRNSWIRFCNWIWYKWQKFKYRFPYILDDISNFFINFIFSLLGFLFAAAFIITLVMIGKTIHDGIKEESEKQKIEKTQKQIVVKCNDIEFRKCILEGHEYWFAWSGYKGGLTHSESCPCITNKIGNINEK